MKLTLNTVSQLAHVGWGAFLTLAILLYSPYWCVAAGMVTGFAAIKEFIFDKLTEDKATQGSDVEDFLFFLLGLAAALVLHKFKTV
jgi:hypothetical protein